MQLDTIDLSLLGTLQNEQSLLNKRKKEVLKVLSDQFVAQVSKKIDQSKGQKIAVFIRGQYFYRIGHTFLEGNEYRPASFKKLLVGRIDPDATGLVINTEKSQSNDFEIPVVELLEEQTLPTRFAPIDHKLYLQHLEHEGPSWLISDFFIMALPPEVRKIILDDPAWGFDSKKRIVAELFIGDEEFAGFISGQNSMTQEQISEVLKS